MNKPTIHEPEVGQNRVYRFCPTRFFDANNSMILHDFSNAPEPERWTDFRHFVCLGTVENRYHANATTDLRSLPAVVSECLATDALETVRRLRDLIENQGIYTNDRAIVLLAHAAAHTDDVVRRKALDALAIVCPTSGELFRFAESVNDLRGWGRGLRNAIAHWYDLRPTNRLVREAIQYAHRYPWNHRDLLRLCHPKPADSTRAALYYWLANGWPGVGTEPHDDPDLGGLWAYEKAKTARDSALIGELIRTYGLPLEGIPERFQTDKTVWSELLKNEIPLETILANLVNLSENAAFSDVRFTRLFCETLKNHLDLATKPDSAMQCVVAKQRYECNTIETGDGPNPAIIEALESAFMNALRVFEYSDANIVLLTDVVLDSKPTMPEQTLLNALTIANPNCITVSLQPNAIREFLATSQMLAPIAIILVSDSVATDLVENLAVLQAPLQPVRFFKTTILCLPDMPVERAKPFSQLASANLTTIGHDQRLLSVLKGFLQWQLSAEASRIE